QKCKTLYERINVSSSNVARSPITLATSFLTALMIGSRTFLRSLMITSSDSGVVILLRTSVAKSANREQKTCHCCSFFLVLQAPLITRFSLGMCGKLYGGPLTTQLDLGATR